MSTLPKSLRSLILTVLLSFAAPIFLAAIALTAFSLLSYLPGVSQWGETSCSNLKLFLSTFGAGSAVQGIVTIGIVSSIAGALFDFYALFRYRQLGSYSSTSSRPPGKGDGCPG